MSHVRKLHLDTSNRLWLLRELYLSLLTDFSTLSREEIVNRRDDLQERVAKVYASAPLTDNKSYFRGNTMSIKNRIMCALPIIQIM